MQFQVALQKQLVYIYFFGYFIMLYCKTAKRKLSIDANHLLMWLTDKKIKFECTSFIIMWDYLQHPFFCTALA